MPRWPLLMLLALGACAGRPDRVATLAPAPVPPPAPMPTPTPTPVAATPGPNDGLTPAATIWHLRAGLNVAALACPGALADQYNALLKSQAATLKTAQTTLSNEIGAQAAYDTAMTRLYNISPSRARTRRSAPRRRRC